MCRKKKEKKKKLDKLAVTYPVSDKNSRRIFGYGPADFLRNSTFSLEGA